MNFIVIYLPKLSKYKNKLIKKYLKESKKAKQIEKKKIVTFFLLIHYLENKRKYENILKNSKV